MLEAQATRSPRRRGLQFSLRTALLLILGAAIFFSVWTSAQQRQENQRLQSEITQLKNERGELSVERGQEHKLHVIAVPTLEVMTWKWQVHVPAGRKFQCKAIVGTVLPDRYPISASGFEIPAGDYVLKLSIHQPDGKHPSLDVQVGNAQHNYGIPVTGTWLEKPGYVVGNRAGEGRTVSVEPGEVLEMIRYQSIVPSQTNESVTEWSDGFLAWICEQP
jgi:hypothetical protein